MVEVPMTDFVAPRGQSSRHIRAGFGEMPITQERRRSDILRNIDTQATEHIVKGTTQINGAGEVTVNVAFPVVYIQAPIFTYGSELVPGNVLVEGKFPIVSAVIAYWDVRQPDLGKYGGPIVTHYRGAKLGCVISGPEDQQILLHWLFTGMAITNPVNSGSSTIGTGIKLT